MSKMNTINKLRFILHVSDFHLTDNEDDIEYAKNALKSLTDKLVSENIKVDYLVHTGDIIESGDLYEKVAEELNLDSSFFSKDEDSQRILFDENIFVNKADGKQKKKFNSKLIEITRQRFKKAEEVFKGFVSDLNISFGSIVICCGNHDALRLFPVSTNTVVCKKNEYDDWEYSLPTDFQDDFAIFEEFLNNMEVANSQKRCGSSESITCCSIDNLNFLIFNTNWKNPKKQKAGYVCTRCDIINSAISKFSKSKDNLNIVLAHKPLYEICEKARLSYQRYIQTPFMSNLRKFIGKNGIYLCGDKHTRSIVGSQFHDIPHYIGGEPLRISSNREVEYNLLEISNNKLGMERKIHLKYKQTANFKWECDICPQDDVVSKLYELSNVYIIEKVFYIIATSHNPNSWEDICQETHNWDKVCVQPWYLNLNKQYQTICKYRNFGSYETSLEKEDILDFVCKQLKKKVGCSLYKNVLNIRGEYSSGKSTFLGILYIYLLNQYSIGKINFIPAYFNLENNEIFKEIKNNDSYVNTAEQIFKEYCKEIQKIAVKEHQPICFIVDGLDEQDCWSYSTEDSVGRALLNVLSEYNNSWYVMSFSQHRLPGFKNTMPARKYKDNSDIMYFNPIDILEKGSNDTRFISFVESFLGILHNSPRLLKSLNEDINIPEITEQLVEQVCDTIRKFRRLTITPGFMYDNIEYIMQQVKTELVMENKCHSDIYKYYIDKQSEKCIKELGYSFVDYAPTMAYLFSYKGYTYEKFKRLQGERSIEKIYTIQPINEHYDQIYHTFLFIKKYRDSREYLVAFHYNQEIRYYAEHPNEPIDPNSILNEFISRNVAVMIRKLWSDTNKFLIACKNLLNRGNLPACMLSVLIYCLAHLKMYMPIRDQIRKKLQDKGVNFLKEVKCDDWTIKNGDSIKKLENFLNLSLKHSIEVFKLMDSNNSIQLVSELLNDKEFRRYNRQFQMLYYEDLSIKGEESRHPLNPERDVLYKGFDFHNCFYYLTVKLFSANSYPLREYDMFTLWDLIQSRLMTDILDEDDSGTNFETFFYRENFENRSNMVLLHTLNIFQKYILCNSSNSNISTTTAFKYFKDVQNVLKEIICIKNEENKTKDFHSKVLEKLDYLNKK